MSHASSSFRALVAALAVLLTVALPAAAQAATTPIALGVNIDNAPDQMSALQSYAQVAGANPAIVMWYQAWSEPLYYSDQLSNMKAFGGVPMITWDPIVNGVGVPLSDIVAGNYDSYILAQAKAAAAWGSLMYIRFAHEMNLSGSPFGPGNNGNTPAEYVAAWRHVVTIFRQAGATNVEWVWSPNVQCGGSCPFTAFYPGDQWVDWVGLDGYNYAGVDNVPWYTFSQVFGPSITSMESLTSKPLMVAETGSSDLGGSMAAWITQAFLTEIPSLYPSIRAAVWFDREKETDWRVNSSAASQTAWDAVVASPLYQGTSATLQSIAPLSSDVTTGTASSTGTGSTGTGSTGTGSGRDRQHRDRQHRHRQHRHRQHRLRRLRPARRPVDRSVPPQDRHPRLRPASPAPSSRLSSPAPPAPSPASTSQAPPQAAPAEALAAMGRNGGAPQTPVLSSRSA